jgi:hypothetical protein
MNAGGELIAEGACWLDERTGQATLEPLTTTPSIRTQRGEMRLHLDSGRTLRVSDRTMVVRIWRPERTNGNNGHHRSLYRLRLIDAPSEAQEANAAGAAGEGAPASWHTGSPRLGEMPAAR